MQQDDTITGVIHENMHNISENGNYEHEYSKQTGYDENNISIENESTEDSYITIYDLKQ